MDIVDPFDQPKRGIVDPFDKPLGATFSGPMAADAAAVAPLAKSDSAAPVIGNLGQGAMDVGATVASRYTPAMVLPQLAAGVAGLATLPQGADAAADKVRSVEQALGYEPQTAAGKVAAAPIDYTFGKVGEFGQYAGKTVQDLTREHPLAAHFSPLGTNPELAGAAAESLITGGLPLLLGKAGVGVRGVADAVKAADLSRGDASIPASIDADMNARPTPSDLVNQLTDSLRTKLKAVDDAAKQPVQPPPAPSQTTVAPEPVAGAAATPPPPAVAATLDKVTGGDPAAKAAIIAKATQGKLLPGETPENLAASSSGSLPPHLQSLADKIDARNAANGFSITDVTPQGYGPSGPSVGSVERNPTIHLTTEQAAAKRSIAEAETLLKGKMSADKRASIERGLAQSRTRLELANKQAGVDASPSLDDKPYPGRSTNPAALSATSEAANVKPGPTPPVASGANTGAGVVPAGDTTAPEAAARAAALAAKPDAAASLHPWTPSSADVSIPLAGGVSDEAHGPHVVIDKRIPQYVTVEDKNGNPVQIDAHEAIGLHERTEYPIMHKDGADYADAHDTATKAENAFVAQKYNVDPEKYQAALQDSIKKAREAAPGSADVPANLDAKPYTDGGDEHLLEAPDFKETKVPDDFSDIRQEIGWDQVGGRLLRAPVEPNSGMLGDVTGRTTWEPKQRADGNGPSNFWGAYRQREGSNALNERQAQAALNKAEDGQNLTIREQRFVDAARKQQDTYRNEYTEDRGAAQEASRQEAQASDKAAREAGMRSAVDYSEYDQAAKNSAGGTGFLPEDRHAQALDEHLRNLGSITDKQRAEVVRKHGDVELDPVFQLPTRKDMVPGLKAAQESGQPSAYGEIDIRGVGNLNAHVGSNSAADVHLKAIGDIVNRHVQEAAKQTGGQAYVVRKGGDELGAITRGVDADTLDKALGNARGEVDAYVKAHGLDKAAPTKLKDGKVSEPGVGLHYGVAENNNKRSIADTITRADTQVEARKVGKLGYEHTGEIEASGPESSGKQARGVGGGANAETGQVGRGPRTSEGQGAERTGETNTAVAEPQLKQSPPKPAAETVAPEQRDTSVRNAATYVDRATHGMEPLDEAEHKGWDESKAEAARAIAADPNYARNLAHEVATKPRTITDAETMALAADRDRLETAWSAADDDTVKAMESGDAIAEAMARAQRDLIQGDLDTNHKATKAGGTELARAMAARNAQARGENYTPARMQTRARVAYRDKMTPKIEKKLRDVSSNLDKSDKAVLDAESKDLSVKQDANAKEQARLNKTIADLEEKLAKRLKTCPL